MSTEIVNALTVDVEDYYQVSAFEHCLDRRQWHAYESRVVDNTERLLALFEKHRVQATFFVLGWVADRFPDLVRSIHRAGHEVGSHSYWHRLIYELTPAEFQEDLVRSCDVLEQITGVKVTAYRAPSFSITQKSLWALSILADHGIDHDSSIFPVRHDRYGMPSAPRFVHRLPGAAWPMLEFPPSVMRLGGQNFPVGGGGYFRLYPLSWTTWCLRAINARHGQPFMFYVHPWEIDPEQPRIAGAGRLRRWRHFVNLQSTEQKLDALLRRFRFGTLSQAIKRVPQGVDESSRPTEPAGPTPEPTTAPWVEMP
jgi:polysaccharide deacetylase family protein (PEP-CTERM system associated)